ncbi:hypothetical protein EV191_1011048 [Tamaricihabitans halophyticus]|uniref:Uncharacterized protein n=1 Tax=Tamaricihabitans halophyticus TaxID=1262583 RepID=A0A4V2SV52_9PSEU|nr:hypothetical protein [Tamaricihabitans halophyticus]TCP57096.1 hypothetical protein EV191_1011048 [Tamaricihabitans halophyticus]
MTASERRPSDEDRRAAQYAALEATATDDDEDLDTVLARMREARKEIARRQRSGST